MAVAVRARRPAGDTQLGTRLDALNHLQIGDRGYNGWTVADLVENLDTSGLAAAGVRSFAFVLTHPKLRGARGGWTSPIAIV